MYRFDLIIMRPGSQPRRLTLSSDSGFRLCSQILVQAVWCFALIFTLDSFSGANAHTPSPATSLGTECQDANAAPLLQSDRQIERELKGGDSHSYRVPMAAGQFMRAVVEQRGVNVRLTLF